MTDERKRKKQLVEELDALRRRVKALESAKLQSPSGKSSSGADLYEVIFKSAPFGMLSVDREGRILRANRAFAGFLGYSIKDLKGMFIQDITHPDDMKESMRKIANLRKDPDKNIQMEKRYIRKDGDVVWGRVNTTIVKSEEGSRATVIAIVQDITENQAMKKRAVEIQDKYERLVQTMNVGIAAVDTGGVITFVNNFLVTALEYSPGELVGVRLDSLLDKENAKIVLDQMKQRREGKAGPYEVTIHAKSGREEIFLLTPSPIFDPDGNLTGSFGVLKNITELRTNKEKLRKSEQQFRQIVESMSDVIFEMDMNLNWTYVTHR